MKSYYRVKQTIEKRGYSISRVEKLLGFNNRTISRWETSEPRLDNITRLALFLDTTLDYLAGISDAPKNQQELPLDEYDIEIIKMMHENALSAKDKAFIKENINNFVMYRTSLNIDKEVAK